MPPSFHPLTLDDEDPFEIDDVNRPHLYKHLVSDTGHPTAVGIADIYDIYYNDDPVFFVAEKEGDATWLMIGEVPGLRLLTPLADAESGDVTKCRPIGLYVPSLQQRARYERERNA
jgi:hypothetical protein